MKTLVAILASAFLLSCASNDANTSVSNSRSNNTSTVNTSATPGHSTMDHNSMNHAAMESSPGAASAPYELQFIDTMITHHQGAVDMAKLADSRAQHQEIKDLAADIIDSQEREIAKMSEWRDGWFDGKQKAINMEFPGMNEGMLGMDMNKLGALRGNEFDLEFIRQMLPHHEGAIVMARDLEKNEARPELKELGQDIITAQQQEIKQMREWLEKWQR